jgi:hypothetical protein
MSDSPASVLFDQFGTDIATTSGIDGVRLGVSAVGTVDIGPSSLDELSTEATSSGIAQTATLIANKDFATQATLSTLATETKLEAVRLLLSSIDSNDFSTEATASGIAQTLTSLNNKDFATETKLEAVRALLASLDSKDYATHAAQTDGSQTTQIVDGPNALDLDSFGHSAARLYDKDGNPIATVSGITVTDTVQLAVQATIAPGQSVSTTSTPGDLSLVVLDTVKNGGSEDLAVNGSLTPVEFVFNADATNDISLNEVRFVLVANTVKIDGASFGPSSTLPNGVLLEIRSDSNTTSVATVKKTEDFLSSYSPGGTTLDRSGSTDLIVAGFYFGGAAKLKAGTGDFVKVTIRDDLSAGTYKHLTCTVHGTKVV